MRALSKSLAGLANESGGDGSCMPTTLLPIESSLFPKSVYEIPAAVLLGLPLNTNHKVDASAETIVNPRNSTGYNLHEIGGSRVNHSDGRLSARCGIYIFC